MGTKVIVLLAGVVFLVALFIGGLVAVAAGAIRKRRQAFAVGALEHSDD